MSVHPRSVHSALFEFKRGNGGRQWPFSEAALRGIIAEVHAVAKKHNRSREIQLRMRRMADATALSKSNPTQKGE